MRADADPDEREFQRRFGPWAEVTPTDAARLLDGFAPSWWISGGWAIEAFTGVGRRHKDVDVTILRRDVPELRRHFHCRYDLWSAGSATLRPLDDRHPLPRWSGQVWMRADALSPWTLDIVLNPGGPRRWVFKRDRSISLPLERATWVAADGIRYLQPELVLAHKLRSTRDVDDGDLEATLPLLDTNAIALLLELLTRSDPTHRWRLLKRMSS